MLHKSVANGTYRCFEYHTQVHFAMLIHDTQVAPVLEVHDILESNNIGSFYRACIRVYL